MNILAVDTSSKYFCLAIGKADKIAVSIQLPFLTELSRKIIPAIDAALKRSKLSLKEIDCFGIGLGPGSFTGLRVGFAVIKGLILPFNKPIVAVGSLDLIANSVGNESGCVCPLVDARRSLVYSAAYSKKDGKLTRKTRYLLVSIEELFRRLSLKGKVTFSGDGLNLYSDIIKKKLGRLANFADRSLWYPEPESLLHCVKEKIKNKEFSDLHKLVPVYLYPKECQVKIA